MKGRIVGTFLAVTLVAAGAVAAPQSPADAARAAADGLRAAIASLKEAEKAQDRIGALTRTIGAYEDGLALLRDSLRQVEIQEQALTEGLAARRDRVARVLGAMTAIGQSPGELVLVHPDGPEATVRASLLLAAIAPGVQSQADDLKIALSDIAVTRKVRTEAAAMLQAGLDAAQEARTALSEAMQDRTGLPRRFIDDPEELKTLVAGAATLDALAEGIATMETDVGPPRADFAGAKGTLALPVRGTVLRKAGAADAAGISRPGIVIATTPDAIVTTPWPATIRYRGPLLDYKNVMILEPANGYLLVLAGLGTVYGDTGDVLAAGAPVGLMAGGSDSADADVTENAAGAGRPETLYLELRQGAEPIDPGPWFRETKDM